MQRRLADSLEAAPGAHSIGHARSARPFRRGFGSSDDPRTDPRYAARPGELPLGESMGELWHRVDRFWREELRPLLLGPARVLVVGHGLALRALARSIEGFAPEALPPWQPASAAPRCYHFTTDLQVAAIEDLDNATAAPDE